MIFPFNDGGSPALPNLDLSRAHKAPDMRVSSGLRLALVAALWIGSLVLEAAVVPPAIEGFFDALGSGCAAAKGDPILIGADDKRFCLEFWLNRYQTLIGALVAIGAAAVGLGAVRAQIRHAQDLEDQRRAREDHAARALLSSALDDLLEYAGTSMRVLDTFKRSGGTCSLALPRLPEVVVGIVREAIRTAEPQHALEMRELLSAIQVFQARARDTRRRPDQVAMNLRDAAGIMARANALFDYARADLTHVPPSAAAVRKVLEAASVDFAGYPTLALTLDAAERSEKGREGYWISGSPPDEEAC